jgi:hypothetical protein
VTSTDWPATRLPGLRRWSVACDSDEFCDHRALSFADAIAYARSHCDRHHTVTFVTTVGDIER